MSRVLWLTDIHLNFVRRHEREAFLESVAAARPSAVLLGGDISESHDVTRFLAQIDDALGCPIYFVLGNHDYYYSSITKVRAAVAGLCGERPHLSYLSQTGFVQLAPGVGLVGHDGWADARLGDYERSYVMMNDYKLIAELADCTKRDRWPKLQALGDEAAAHIARVLPAALDMFPLVYLLTHVPPFREACWHEGRLSDDEWAPHFTCKAVGDAILASLEARPDRRLIVLCGHTHGGGEVWPLPNVQVLTGGAVYGQPSITREFELE